MWALFLALFIVNVGFGLVIPILPFFALEVGATPSQVGLLVSAYAFTQFLTAPIWGWLTDRLGARKVVVIGTVGLSISLIAFARSDELWMLFAARLAGGAMASAPIPAALTLTGYLTRPSARGAAMSMMSSGIGAGFIVGPAMGGYLSRWGLGAPFFLSAGISLLAASLAYFIPPKPVAAPVEPVDSSAEKDRAMPPRRRVKDPEAVFLLMVFLAVVLLANLADANRQGTIALYALDRFQAGGDLVGFQLTLMGTTFVVLQLTFVGRMIDRHGEFPVLLAGILLNILGFGAVPLTWDFWSLTAAVCIQGAGMACVFTSVPSLISKQSGEKTGTVMGLRTSAEGIGRVVGPVFGGWVYEFNVDYPYLTGAALYFASLILGGFAYLVRGSRVRLPSALQPRTHEPDAQSIEGAEPWH